MPRQRRLYDMNIWSERKKLEKLDYMQGNPVRRRLVASPEQWPWSSLRFYYLGGISVMAMDPMT
jgi:putative transposase